MPACRQIDLFLSLSYSLTAGFDGLTATVPLIGSSPGPVNGFIAVPSQTAAAAAAAPATMWTPRNEPLPPPDPPFCPPGAPAPLNGLVFTPEAAQLTPQPPPLFKAPSAAVPVLGPTPLALQTPATGPPHARQLFGGFAGTGPQWASGGPGALF